MDLRAELLKSIWYAFTALDVEKSGKVSKSQLKVSPRGSGGGAGTAPAQGWWVGCEGQSGARDAPRPPWLSTEELLNIQINRTLLLPPWLFW